jgi:hypothetical protein
MNLRKLFPLFALLFSTFVLACAPPYDADADDELVAEAEGAQFAVYPDPTNLKDAITNGATHDPSFNALVVSGNFKRPQLDENDTWQLVDPVSVNDGIPSWSAEAMPILPVTFAYLSIGEIWTEAYSNQIAGVPDYAGIVYTAGGPSGDHYFEESWKVIVSGTYPMNSPAGTYCKLGDP